MRRALARLTVRPDVVLVDGLPCPELGCPHQAIVDGDARCHSIAAASVIAKTVRDRLMGLLGGRSEEHTSELQSQSNLVCRLLLEKKKKHTKHGTTRIPILTVSTTSVSF